MKRKKAGSRVRVGGLTVRKGGWAAGDHSIDTTDPWDTQQSEDSQDSQDSEPPPDSHDSERPTIDSDDPWGDTASNDTSDILSAIRFAAVIDPEILASEEAARRIEKAIRQAVLAEVAAAEFLGEYVISSVAPGGARGITVRRRR
jgi:hypothetical protein